MTLYQHETGGDDEYATHPDLWRPISRSVGGFDLDPCSGAESERIADTVYTADDDGLSQSWEGTVWLNPPFSEKKKWLRKAINEHSAGRADLIVVLVPVDTSTQWFQNYFAECDLMCWLEGRDWFQADGSPAFNSVVGVYGDAPDALVSTLGKMGYLTRNADHDDTRQSLWSDFSAGGTPFATLADTLLNGFRGDFRARA